MIKQKIMFELGAQSEKIFKIQKKILMLKEEENQVIKLNKSKIDLKLFEYSHKIKDLIF